MGERFGLIVRRVQAAMMKAAMDGIKDHGVFKNEHEMLGVLLCEVNEMALENEMVKKDCEAVMKHIMQHNEEDACIQLGALQNHAIMLAAEAIQVAGVCEKYLRSERLMIETEDVDD